MYAPDFWTYVRSRTLVHNNESRIGMKKYDKFMWQIWYDNQAKHCAIICVMRSFQYDIMYNKLYKSGMIW